VGLLLATALAVGGFLRVLLAQQGGEGGALGATGLVDATGQDLAPIGRLRYIASRAERRRIARNYVWAFNLAPAFPRGALTLCPQLCLGIQPGARFPARGADALPSPLFGH
jgi:hypothetical protein